MRLSNRNIAIIIWCCIFATGTIYAQKSRKAKKQKVITAKSLREAEYLFTEGQKFFMLEDYAKALAYYEKSLEFNPDNATVYFKMAEIQSENKSFDDAESNIEKAISLNSSNKYFYLLAASIYNQKGKYEKATIAYETMLGKINNTEQYYPDLATLYLYQKRYDDAIQAYEQAEKTLGVSPGISYQKQKVYLEINRLDDAIAEGEKLIKTFPLETDHTLSLINILIANNQHNKAAKLLDQLLAQDPNHGKAMLLLADIQKSEGDLETYQHTVDKIFNNPDINLNIKIQLIAEDTYQISQARSSSNPNTTLEQKTVQRCKTLIENNPQEAQIYALCGDLYYSLADKGEALSQYTRSLAIDKSNFQVWQNVMQIESELGDNKSLVKHTDEALEYFPNQSIVYMYAGLAHLQLKAYDEAATMLEQGKKLSIQNQRQLAIFSSLLGSAYNGSKDYSKSDIAYKKALEINPQDHQTLNNYSYFLSLRKENLEDAEKMAQKVVAMDPENATYLDTYAWVLYMRKKYKEARVQMEKAIKAGTPSAINFDHYGDILFRLGKIDEAVEQWKKAKELDQSLEKIDKKIKTRTIDE